MDATKIPVTIFAIMGGLIVLAMFMGRKGKDQQASYGWWLGLVVLLLVVSGFLGISRLRVMPVTEERHRNVVTEFVSDLKQDIHSGMQDVRNSIQDGMSEARNGLEEAKRAMASINESRVNSKGKKGSQTTVRVVNTTSKPPLSPIEWTVTLQKNERSQSQEIVKERLYQKATDKITQWVRERLPMKSVYFPIVDVKKLETHGILSEEIEFEKEEVERSNSSDKDPLFGGKLKIVLTPQIQEELTETGYQALESFLQKEHLEIQGMIFANILGLTLVAGIVGLMRSYLSRRRVQPVH